LWCTRRAPARTRTPLLPFSVAALLAASELALDQAAAEQLAAARQAAATALELLGQAATAPLRAHPAAAALHHQRLGQGVAQTGRQAVHVPFRRQRADRQGLPAGQVLGNGSQGLENALLRARRQLVLGEGPAGQTAVDAGGDREHRRTAPLRMLGEPVLEALLESL